MLISMFFHLFMTTFSLFFNEEQHCLLKSSEFWMTFEGLSLGQSSEFGGKLRKSEELRGQNRSSKKKNIKSRSIKMWSRIWSISSSSSSSIKGKYKQEQQQEKQYEKQVVPNQDDFVLLREDGLVHLPAIVQMGKHETHFESFAGFFF